ncbi:MAG: hypothetical protein ACKO96_31810, partial [Flammeovirgaceae bacterium]
DVVNNSVVEDSTIKDCPIKEALRWARIKQLMFVHRCAKKIKESDNMNAETPFDGMAGIMNNSAHFSLILKMCIGNGDSITKST